MLKMVELRNYRGFEQHRIPLRPESIIVGRNNAGKSTVIEALRLISIATERYRFLNFRNVPGWLEIPRTLRGISPSLQGLEITLENLFHRYGDPPASVTAEFQSGEGMSFYIGPDGNTHVVLRDAAGRTLTSKAQTHQLTLPRVSVLPQVAPVARDERVLMPDYVRRAMSSALAPLHFRNQLNLFYREHFGEFRELVESTWPGVRIRNLVGRGGLPGSELALLVQDVDFTAEVAWMGHGLQMWLQVMWFLARSHSHDTVILDEPDVYMHPELQRKLVRILRGRYPQVIVATHSTEILAEADPEHILIVDRTTAESRFSVSLPAVQEVLERIGSAQSIQLTRLWNARRVLLVEGKDVKLLRRFQDKLFPDSPTPLDATPNMSIGGWNGWPYAVGSSMFLRNAAGEEIIPYCILDSDYHTRDEIRSRLDQAAERGVQLHIWSWKEIENYLLVPSAIHRTIASQVAARTEPPALQEVEERLDQIAENLKDTVQDAIANEYFNRNRAGGITSANREARRIVNEAWDTREGKLALVSGKEVLSQMARWSQENFGVSFGPYTIAHELRREEIAAEVARVLQAIESSEGFD